jgi:hypothetical protein
VERCFIHRVHLVVEKSLVRKKEDENIGLGNSTTLGEVTPSYASFELLKEWNSLT